MAPSHLVDRPATAPRARSRQRRLGGTSHINSVRVRGLPGQSGRARAPQPADSAGCKRHSVEARAVWSRRAALEPKPQPDAPAGAIRADNRNRHTRRNGLASRSRAAARPFGRRPLTACSRGGTCGHPATSGRPATCGHPATRDAACGHPATSERPAADDATGWSAADDDDDDSRCFGAIRFQGTSETRRGGPPRGPANPGQLSGSGRQYPSAPANHALQFSATIHTTPR